MSCQRQAEEPRRLYQTLIGPKDDKTLILSTHENWLPTESEELADSVTIACKEGFVNIEEMR
jgi:hypothetical protein